MCFSCMASHASPGSVLMPFPVKAIRRCTLHISCLAGRAHNCLTDGIDHAAPSQQLLFSEKQFDVHCIYTLCVYRPTHKNEKKTSS